MDDAASARSLILMKLKNSVKKIIIIGGGFHSNSILDIISRAKTLLKFWVIWTKKTKLKIKYLEMIVFVKM